VEARALAFGVGFALTDLYGWSAFRQIFDAFGGLGFPRISRNLLKLKDLLRNLQGDISRE